MTVSLGTGTLSLGRDSGSAGTEALSLGGDLVNDGLVDSGNGFLGEDGMRRREGSSRPELLQDVQSEHSKDVRRRNSRLAAVRILDAELVRRAAAKDRDAYRELVERYQSRALSIAVGILKNREDAEDVVQESFVKAYMSLPDFKGNSSFYTWLYRIVYNMSIDVKRKAIRNAVYESSLDEKELDRRLENSSISEQTPDEHLLRKEKLKCIDRAMQEISEEHRTVIMLREIEGMDYQQIAEVTGVSKGTIMSRLHYARKKLQKALEAVFSGTETLSLGRDLGSSSSDEVDSKNDSVVVRNE